MPPRLRLSALFGLCGLLLLGCQSNPVSVDYDTQADFSGYRQYAWKQDTSGIGENIDPLMEERVKAAIADVLKEKNIERAPADDGADFLVRYFVNTATQTKEPKSRGRVGIGSAGGNTAVGLSIGIPLGGKRITHEVAIIIDFHDVETDSLRWRGTTRVPLGNETPEEREALIREAVADVLGRFPPSKD